MKTKLVVLVIGLAAVLVSTLYLLSGNKADETVQNNSKETIFVTQESVSDAGRDIKKYADYSQSLFVSEVAKKRVFFFHANWCPTCKAADREFLSRTNSIPDDVILFKTDYDSETEMKRKYGITYQHTFVYVDREGNEIRKWNGGGIDELVNNTK